MIIPCLLYDRDGDGIVKSLLLPTPSMIDRPYSVLLSIYLLPFSFLPSWLRASLSLTNLKGDVGKKNLLNPSAECACNESFVLEKEERL